MIARRHGILLLALVMLCLLAPEASALTSGRFTDYVYESNYKEEKSPQQTQLACEFFRPGDNTTCKILDRLPQSARVSTLLGLIKKDNPEEMQDWARYWNSQVVIGSYYEQTNDSNAFNTTDGAKGENGSIRNAWFRLISLYPSVIDDKDGYYYLPDQALATTQMNMRFVIPNPSGGDYCAQEYKIKGYDVELTRNIGNWTAKSPIIPAGTILEDGQKANLTIRLEAVGEYQINFSKLVNATECERAVCNVTMECKPFGSNSSKDSVNISQAFPVKHFPGYFEYKHQVAVPQAGYAQGLVELRLPKDIIYYQLTVKGLTLKVSRNEISLKKKGDAQQFLQAHLIPAPAAGGTLNIARLDEEIAGDEYNAKIWYKLLLDKPDLAESDCSLKVATPFAIKEYVGECLSARATPQIEMRMINRSKDMAHVSIMVKDQLSIPLEGVDIELSSESARQVVRTNAQGIASADVKLRPSAQTAVAKALGSWDVADAQAIIFLPGADGGVKAQADLASLVGKLAPIFLMILLVITLMAAIMRRRSGVAFITLIAMLLILSPASFAQAGITDGADVRQTLDACKNYDFDNAVRHFGECAESFRISSEFSSMRRTAAVLVQNIAPLVVATPDIVPYRTAYVNMVQIALSLFRVVWAFNSLYLILNIFNPTKRSEALKQYIWLIVFVIFTYSSYLLLQNSIAAVNTISNWVAGTEAANNLAKATLSVEFVSENYEMLKLVLPFLNMTYLVLLARYLTVIGMVLFFPFSLLLFFTHATRGFGQAALTVTFAALGLGVLNSILLLIYNILVTTSDPALAGGFAATFFSASFVVFFGFVNLLALLIAFLSGIIFIGQTKVAAS